MTDFFGRLHPLVLHIPIGVFVYCYAQWLYDYVKGRRHRRSESNRDTRDQSVDLNFGLFLGVSSAIIAAISGWFLAQEGGYDQELLDWHKYMGIGTAVFSVVIMISYRTRFFFGTLMTIFMVLLGVTGHYGGSLTHGKDFLTGPAVKEEKVIVDISQANMFTDVVMPIAEAKCVSCHNPQKSKGELLLHDLQSWEEGGEHGPILVAGDPKNSQLIQRIHLPKSDEEHMPPDGKLQLSNDEITFLDWWVTNMKTYQDVVADLQPTAAVSKYLQSLVNDPEADLKDPKIADLNALRSIGIVATKLSNTSKWIDVTFEGVKDVQKKHFNALSEYSANVRSMDVSSRNITNSEAKGLTQFENLKSLNISRNPISDKTVEVLSELSQIEVINLFGTEITNESIQQLSEYSNLERAYVWQTKVTREGIDAVVATGSSINFTQGIDQSIFGSPKLVAPMIDVDTDFFEDSIRVSLSASAAKGRIYYTTDGSAPDESAILYQKPFTVKKSSIVKAFVTMDGWTNSDVTAKTLVRASYKVADITLAAEPNDKYAAEGGATLIDYARGSESFGDGKWIAFYESGFEAVLDLGIEGPVSGVSVGALLDYKSYIFPPTGINVEISKDGESYQPLATQDIDPITGPQENETMNLLVTADQSRMGRYLKVTVDSQKYNPEWHGAPGAPCWVFVDEIVVE